MGFHLENPPEKILSGGPFSLFIVMMVGLTPFIIFIIVIIDINIIYFYFLMGLASKIGIKTVYLNGLINFVTFIVFFIIYSKRRQQKD